MHGRVKRTEPSSAEEVAHREKKSASYRMALEQVMLKRKSRVYSRDALALTEKLLLINPDLYTLWNYRREIILELMTENELSEEDCMHSELEVTKKTIIKNPKCYGSWFHRKWILSLCEVDLKCELELCNQFLTADERNFHCWNYRRSVSRRLKSSPREELEFSQQKIDENFSNYSSFHHRSIFLSDILLLDSEALEEEIELVKQAAFTEPDDQTCWIYHRWLMEDVLPTVVAEKEAQEMKLREATEWCYELLEVEHSSKWCLSTLAFLHARLSSMAADGHDRLIESQKAMGIYRQLQSIDPMHSLYYEFEIGHLV